MTKPNYPVLLSISLPMKGHYENYDKQNLLFECESVESAIEALAFFFAGAETTPTFEIYQF